MKKELTINIIDSEFLAKHFLETDKKTKEIISLQSILNAENALMQSMLTAMRKLEENIFNVK